MTALGQAARFHDKMNTRTPSHAPSHGSDASPSPHSPMAYSAGHQIVIDDSAVGKRFTLHAAGAFLGIAAVVGVGLAVMPKADDGGTWRNAFALHVNPNPVRVLKIGAVSLGLKPESIYALPTRPYFGRTSDGRITAEFAMDGGAYTIWFTPDREGRRAQRIRFAKTFDGATAEDVLKTQVSSFGSPVETECSRLLAHLGRKHCRYAWDRPDGTTATLTLRSPATGAMRTDMVLSLSAPAKVVAPPQRHGTAGTSL